MGMKMSEWLAGAKRKVDALDAELIALACFAGDSNEVGGVDGELGLQVDRSWLIAHDVVKITTEMREKADEMVARRAQGEPLAFILGWREFYGRYFEVNREVLIPRPETENLVDLTLELMRGARNDFGDKEPYDGGLRKKGLKEALNGSREQKRDEKAQILEVGTGSGCIAVILAQELPETEVLAVDVSENALEVAGRNNGRYGRKVRMWQSDLLDDVRNWDKMTLIVANLPYVDRNWEWLDQRSLGYEPDLALYAERGGLALYEKLLRQIKERIEDAGREAEEKVQLRYLVAEADPCQHERLEELAAKYGWRMIKREGYGLAFSRDVA